MTTHIRSETANGVLTLTLNRPEKKNALTRAMYQALADGLTAADHDPETRCVLLQAEGDIFTAGNDLGDFAAIGAADAADRPRGLTNPFLQALANATTPIVAAVNGRAVGVGTTMLLHCDLVFVSDDALLTTPFVNLALVPEAASTLLLPARIGHARAFAMFVLGEAVNAERAAAWGLANAVCPRAELRATARAAAEAIAARPPTAVTITKALMRDRPAIAERMQTEGGHFATQLQSAEAREAFAAFAEKRAPDFARRGAQMSRATGLAGKTLFITGASRGIGLAIGLRAARDGANVAIAAKTAEPHRHLPGTIYTAAKEIEAAGGRALPLVVDVRDEASVSNAVDQTVRTFGGIDICVNNASAIQLTGTVETEMKRYDLMNQVNARGSFVTSKACIPHLKRAANPHVLMISPPLDMSPRWFERHTAYTMAKFGMSMCVLGMAAEFRSDGIAFNALWPRTIIATAAIQFVLGGDERMRRCRTPAIMADAACAVFAKPSRTFSGNFLIDDTFLYAEGERDFEKYRIDRSVPLAADFFVPDDIAPPPGVTTEVRSY